MNKVNILSMGWRSHWLSRRLNSLGVEVSLFEVTDHAGWTHPEDIDGPFPFSITADSPEDFVNLSQTERSLEFLESGFCMSTVHGNLAWNSFNKEKTLAHYKEVFEKDSAEGEPFWFDDFMKSFSKSTFKKSALWGADDKDFNLNADLHLRRSDRMTYSTSIDLLEERGVEVQMVSNQDLNPILSEVKSRSKDWIMSLTIPELKLLTYNRVENLDTNLGWHRKRFFYETDALENLPVWSVWLESSFRPWKEDNLVILIKGRDTSYIDVWTLEAIYQDNIREVSRDRALKFLNDKFEYVDFLPQKSENLEGALKSLFPVSQDKEVQNDANYIWNSPLEWGGYSLELMYNYQNNLAQMIYDKGAGS